MGCDCHSHVEIQVNNKWVYAGQISISRNYALFGVLAGVRNEDITCVSGKEKGLPKEVSKPMSIFSEDYGRDGHSHSYLDYNEMLEAKKIYEKYTYENWQAEKEQYRKFPKGIIETMEQLKTTFPKITNVRLVFYFDN